MSRQNTNSNNTLSHLIFKLSVSIDKIKRSKDFKNFEYIYLNQYIQLDLFERYPENFKALAHSICFKICCIENIDSNSLFHFLQFFSNGIIKSVQYYNIKDVQYHQNTPNSVITKQLCDLLYFFDTVITKYNACAGLTTENENKIFTPDFTTTLLTLIPHLLHTDNISQDFPFYNGKHILGEGLVNYIKHQQQMSQCNELHEILTLLETLLEKIQNQRLNNQRQVPYKPSRNHQGLHQARNRQGLHQVPLRDNQVPLRDNQVQAPSYYNPNGRNHHGLFSSESHPVNTVHTVPVHTVNPTSYHHPYLFIQKAEAHPNNLHRDARLFTGEHPVDLSATQYKERCGDSNRASPIYLNDRIV